MTFGIHEQLWIARNSNTIFVKLLNLYRLYYTRTSDGFSSIEPNTSGIDKQRGITYTVVASNKTHGSLNRIKSICTYFLWIKSDVLHSYDLRSNVKETNHWLIGFYGLLFAIGIPGLRRSVTFFPRTSRVSQTKQKKKSLGNAISREFAHNIPMQTLGRAYGWK